MPWISFWQKPVSKKELMSFGWLMGGAFLAASAALFYAEQNAFIYFLLGSILFLLAALAAPITLKPVWLTWMTASQILGKIVTSVLLCLVFFAGICLISIVMRLGRKKITFRDTKQNSQTYWIKRIATTSNSQNMEVQY